MPNQKKSLSEVIVLMREAVSLLRSAEVAWPDAVESANFPSDAPEIVMLEDLLHVVNHEEQSTLAFALQDIDGLLERIEIRRKYSIFDSKQIDTIVTNGWSTSFVRELHESHPTIPISELSTLVKELCAEWINLRKISRSVSDASIE